jgi:hypothetical protein
MRIRVVVSALAAFFLLAAGAQAFQWHMSYGQAKHASKEFAKEACRGDKECARYGVGPCLRASESRFDCIVEFFYAEAPEPGKEVQCDIVLHWGVDKSGFLALKNYGKPHCFVLD